jgi:HTH-type transcriptional regulator/antitoxin HipB
MYAVKGIILRGMKPLRLQTPAQLADHLRSFRKARGLTQAALGELTGLGQTRIAKIERNPTLVSVGQLLRLLGVLQVRVLLDPASDEPQSPVSARSTDW